MKPTLSVVIRAYNEAKRLHRLLTALKGLPVEIVVVDNGSTDQTAAVIREFGVKSVYLNQEEFNYPKSSNLGVAKATGEIVVMFSGHCLPEGDWLSIILPYFADPKVGGVYTSPLPEKDSPLFERSVARIWHLWNGLFHPILRLQNDRLGVLDMTNAAFRRSIWEQHHFDEGYGAGGEDGEFAHWMFKHGYYVVRDLHYRVRHSHYLTFKKALAQQRLWRRLYRPQPFDPSALSFRDDIKRS